MTEQRRPEPRAHRGTEILPRHWNAWSADERDVWHERQDATARADALSLTLRDALAPPEREAALDALWDVQQERIQLTAELVLCRLRRYRPDLDDLLVWAFDLTSFFHEDLAIVQDPRWLYEPS